MFYFAAALLVAALNAHCVSVYAALSRIRKNYITNNDDRDPALIEKIAPFYKDPSHALAGSQFACTLCTALFLLMMEEFGRNALDFLADIGIDFPLWLDSVCVFGGFALVMTLYWIFTERVPGDAALVHPLESIADRAWLLRLVGRVLRPLIAAGLFVTRRVLRLRGLPVTNEVEFTYSEDEIRCIVEESHHSGKLSALENLLIKNSFDFFDLIAEEVMVPRSELDVLYYGDDVRHMMEILSKSHHTWYPVCRDDKDNVLGAVHVKDFLELTVRGGTDIKNIIRNVLIVPEIMPTPKLLQLMRSRRIYLAVVVDEYGGTVGLVTLKDLIEELVGEIPEETDPAPVEIMAKDDGTFEFDGMVILDDISDRLGVEFPEETGTNTIGGYIFSLLERIPAVGDTCIIGAWKFTVLRMDGFRVIRVKAEQATGKEIVMAEEESKASE